MSLSTLELILVFIFGSCIGSFLNVVIWRLPREEKLTGRSHCPFCGRTLQPQDLFPIFSYIFLRGKCRICKKNISFRYPLIELVTALLFVFAFQNFFGLSALSILTFVKILLGLSVLICVFAIDLEHFLILDSILLPSSLIIVLINLIADLLAHNLGFSMSSSLFGGIVAGVIGSLPLFLIWFFSQGRYMGFGDVKLLLFLGVLLGWPNVLAALFLGIVLGGLVGLCLILINKKTLQSKLPLGTFLAVSSAFCLFYGQALVKFYLAYIGL